MLKIIFLCSIALMIGFEIDNNLSKWKVARLVMYAYIIGILA